MMHIAYMDLVRSYTQNIAMLNDAPSRQSWTSNIQQYAGSIHILSTIAQNKIGHFMAE